MMFTEQFIVSLHTAFINIDHREMNPEQTKDSMWIKYFHDYEDTKKFLVFQR